MSDVFRQLVRYDCSATLVTEAADGRMAIVAVYPAEAGAATDDASDRQPRAGANDCPVHQDTEIGMLLLYMDKHPNIRCRLIEPGCDMQLVDSGKDDDLSPCS